jgi:hypothetical protein
MIGGGEYLSFENLAAVDQELVVRAAEIHALMPMMQFSVAPWRVLSAGNLAITRRMAALHTQHGPAIVALAAESAKTGVPIARTLDYSYPGHGYEATIDEFLLGPDIFVAPVVEKGAPDRLAVPPGRWKATTECGSSGVAWNSWQGLIRSSRPYGRLKARLFATSGRSEYVCCTRAERSPSGRRRLQSAPAASPLFTRYCACMSWVMAGTRVVILSSLSRHVAVAVLAAHEPAEVAVFGTLSARRRLAWLRRTASTARA